MDEKSSSKSCTTSLSPLFDPTILAGCTFGLLGSILILLQFDIIGRRILSAPTLRERRRRALLHRLDNAISDSICEIRGVLTNRDDSDKGGATTGSEGGGTLDASLEISALTVTIQDMDEIRYLAESIAGVKGDNDKNDNEHKNIAAVGTPLIVGIAKGLDPGFSGEDEYADPNEWYIYLAFPPPTTKTTTSNDDGKVNEEKGGLAPYRGRRVRAPLSRFGEALAIAFEQKLTSTALCFVADASGGYGTKVLSSVFNGCGTGMAVINEPTWMITLAYITTTTIISRSKMSRILYGLCRLHAHRIRNNVSTRGHSRTITFILPGQACVPSILPSIVDAFPHERHVFVYDGCVRSVVSSSSSTNINAVVEVGSIPSYITSSTPLSTSTLRNNLGGGSGGREKYDVLLSQLSVNVACVVETWMASVDTFLRVKTEEKGPDAEDINNDGDSIYDHNYSETGGRSRSRTKKKKRKRQVATVPTYLPFVCRLGAIVDNEKKSDLALKNLLQYVTGSSSRPIPSNILNSANSIVSKFSTVAATALTPFPAKAATTRSAINAEKERINIEACVFMHKGILIGNKTLLDTVKPEEGWSLLAAKKLTSCACCDPEEDDEDDEEDDNVGYSDEDGENMKSKRNEDGKNIDEDDVIGGDSSKTSNISTPSENALGYVNGKSAFAFDPSLFTGLK